MNRRQLLALGAGAFALAVAPFPRRGRRLVRRRVPLMGTVAEFAVAGSGRAVHEAIDAAVAELHLVDRTLSRFRADSDVGRANHEASRRPVAVRASTLLVLSESLRWADASGGAFDPCLGRAVELWDVNRRREPPPEGAVRALAGRRLYAKLELGRSAIRFAAPDVAIDLGGVGKGYAVDRAVEALRARGVRDAIVNLGGDLYAMGESEDGDAWRVGVRSADGPARCAATLELRDRAVATSGDYLQAFRHGGVAYHHLLDPATGAPRVAPRHSLTVAAATCLDADAAATALFGMEGVEAARVLRATAPGARIVATA